MGDGQSDAEGQVAPTPGDPPPSSGAPGSRVTTPKRRLIGRPSSFAVFGFLFVLIGFGIAGGLLFPDRAFGQACAIGLVPILSIVIGVLGNHVYSKMGLDKELSKVVGNALYTTLHLKRSVLFVYERLASARALLESGQTYHALIEVVRAETATELSLGTAQQSSLQWESISESGARAALARFVEDDDEMRPVIKQGTNPKVVRAEGDEDEDGTKRTD